MSAGVDIQIIEILVLGLPSSGKSSFVEALNANREETDGWRSTYIDVDDSLQVRFIEPPPQANFDFMWCREIIEYIDTDGFIMVADSVRSEDFGEMVSVLQTTRVFHPKVPVLLVANKQDQSQAWRVEDIRMGLGIPDEIHIVPCVATQLHTVREAVLDLLYQIMAN